MLINTKYPYDENLATGYEYDGAFSCSDSQKFGFLYFSENPEKLYEIRGNGLSEKSMERYQYDPYGRRKVMNAGYGEMVESSIGQEFGYTGRRHDSEGTDLQYFRARYYSSSLGRFISRDPLGTALDVDWMSALGRLKTGLNFNDGMSLYCSFFVVNRTDPMGKVAVPTKPDIIHNDCKGTPKDKTEKIPCADGSSGTLTHHYSKPCIVLEEICIEKKDGICIQREIWKGWTYSSSDDCPKTCPKK